MSILLFVWEAFNRLTENPPKIFYLMLPGAKSSILLAGRAPGMQ